MHRLVPLAILAVILAGCSIQLGDTAGTDGGAAATTATSTTATSTTVTSTAGTPTTAASPSATTTTGPPNSTVTHPGSGITVAAAQEAAGAVARINAGGFTNPAGFDTDYLSTGNGVILDPEGHMLTAAHLVTAADSIDVFIGGQTTPIPASVVATDLCDDLAVLDLAGDGYDHVSTNPTFPDAGMAVTYAGYPSDLPAFTLSEGVVADGGPVYDSPLATINRNPLFETTNPPYPGMFGAPAFDDAGNAIGIVFPTPADGTYLNAFALIDDVVSTLLEGSDIADNGLNLLPWPNDDGSHPDGLFVRAVAVNSPAADAGIKPGDVITNVDGSPAMNPSVGLATYCDAAITHGTFLPIPIKLWRPSDGLIYSGALSGSNPVSPSGQSWNPSGGDSTTTTTQPPTTTTTTAPPTTTTTTPPTTTTTAPPATTTTAPAGAATPTITLRAGDLGDQFGMFWNYDVALTGYVPSSTVTLHCADSDNHDYATSTVTVAADGSYTNPNLCNSIGGPAHWVYDDDGHTSNVMIWGYTSAGPIAGAPLPDGDNVGGLDWIRYSGWLLASEPYPDSYETATDSYGVFTAPKPSEWGLELTVDAYPLFPDPNTHTPYGHGLQLYVIGDDTIGDYTTDWTVPGYQIGVAHKGTSDFWSPYSFLASRDFSSRCDGGGPGIYTEGHIDPVSGSGDYNGMYRVWHNCTTDYVDGVKIDIAVTNDDASVIMWISGLLFTQADYDAFSRMLSEHTVDLDALTAAGF